ncbi:hypothetical protein [Clostridium rectalis]|uniref:hypothetical protein n=1 Tax=Clostridium rectalis TaxID=2040295 RepID=UPI000F63D30C|nr:hypothetical protein [Clostridium rectalis]
MHHRGKDYILDAILKIPQILLLMHHRGEDYSISKIVYVMLLISFMIKLVYEKWKDVLYAKNQRFI